MYNRNIRALVFACSTIALLLAFSATLQAKPADREIVKFRLASWKTAHFKDAAEASKQLATLKKIGCETKQHKHGDHIDVSYRCPSWKSIALKTHDEAHQWQQWLKTVGFETSHTH